MVARLLALIGLLLIGAGLVLPVACPESGCEIPANGLIDPENFETDVETGILLSVYGMLTAAAAIPGVIGFFSKDRGAMLYSALATTAVVAVSFGVVSTNLPETATLSYGWVVLGSGAAVWLLAAMLMKAPLAVAAGGAQASTPRYTGNKTLIEQAPSLNKTRIEGVPSAGIPSGMNKTAIDVNFQNRNQAPPQYQQPNQGQPQQPGYGYGMPPAQPQQQNLPPIPGFGEPINPLQKTLVDSPNVEAAQMQQFNATPAQNPQPGAPPQYNMPPTNPAAAPVAQPEEDPTAKNKTVIDGIIAPPSAELDPLAWQKDMQKEMQVDPEKTVIDQIEEPAAPPPPPPPPAPAQPSAPPNGEMFKTNIAPIADDSSNKTNVVPTVDPNVPPSEFEGRTAMISTSEELRAQPPKPKINPEDVAFKTMLSVEMSGTPEDVATSMKNDVSDVQDDPPSDNFKTFIEPAASKPPQQPLDDMKTFIDIPSSDDDDDDIVKE